MARIDELRERLFEAGTHLSAVPPDWPGLTVSEWTEMVWLIWREAVKLEPAPVALPRISTSRDNYGWRSLPSGTRYLGGA